MSIRSKILTPIDYLRINHPEKRWFDFVIPVVLSAIVVVILNLLPKSISLIGKDSLVSLVNGILQILSGFYIASMAAVATFQKAGMDDVMTGSPPTLRGQPLTRRRFLTYLFGYLAFISIGMYFAGGAVQLSSASIQQIGFESHAFWKNTFLFVYIFFVFNIILTTALGMFFMIDKMHEEKPVLKITPPPESSEKETD
ncbi:TPA: hypothetical protein ACQ4J9_001814 [Yersinia enterocolitica]